jgi:phosphate transport system permease protein
MLCSHFFFRPAQYLSILQTQHLPLDAQSRLMASSEAVEFNGLLIEGEKGSLDMLVIENEHPEISFSSLWQKVWYENYERPE